METELPKSISVRRNAAANYIGTFCQAILGFVFVPFYIKYLGIENYGLIGFSVSLSALFRLADLGLSSTLNREFARCSAMPESAQRMRSLLKTLQTVYWAISLLFGLVIVLCAPLIARYWINSGSLDVAKVQNAVMLMGLTIALQGPMSLYLGGVFGLQRHVLGNVINIVFAALRFGGVVLALALLSPTLTMFFAFQLGVTFIGAICTGIILWSFLPQTDMPSRFEISQLKSVWRFAAGMSMNSVLWLILSQLDKIILIKVLPLKMFGYYALASTAAATVTYLGGPLYTTFLPRYTQLYTAGDNELLRKTYRRSCCLNAIIMIPTVVLLSLYSREALLFWTGNPDIAGHASLLLSFLVIGHGLNQLALISIALQVATNWLKLGVYTNTIAVILYIPTLVITTHFYKASGAAAGWIALNCFYVFVYVNVMHTKILKGESKYWYLGTLLPLFLSICIGFAGRDVLSALQGMWLVVSVGIMWITIVVISLMANHDLKGEMLSLLKQLFKIV